MKRTPLLIPVYLLFVFVYPACNKNENSGSNDRYKPEYVENYQVNVTEYGAAHGGYVSGTFSCMVRDSAGTRVAPLSCSFRVKRP